MSRRSKSGKSDSFPKILVTAQRYAERMNKRVRREEAESDSRIVPILQVMHGKIPVLVRHLNNEIISVFIMIPVEEKVRENLGKMEKTEQKRLFILLKNQLLSQARTGYSLRPDGAGRLQDIEQIIVSQEILISNQVPSSFNRFADAIQEVVILAVKASQIFGALQTETTGDKIEKIDPPEQMYV